MYSRQTLKSLLDLAFLGWVMSDEVKLQDRVFAITRLSANGPAGRQLGKAARFIQWHYGINLAFGKLERESLQLEM